HIDTLEQQIDKWQKELPELRNFILPSGHIAASTLHHAITVARRAERIAVSIQDEIGATLAITYLNRLSDYLFVTARYANQLVNGEEKPLKAEDRKSTRLNSSHVSISYAVLCLKKKNDKERVSREVD